VSKLGQQKASLQPKSIFLVRGGGEVRSKTRAKRGEGKLRSEKKGAGDLGKNQPPKRDCCRMSSTSCCDWLVKGGSAGEERPHTGPFQGAPEKGGTNKKRETHQTNVTPSKTWGGGTHARIATAECIEPGETVFISKGQRGSCANRKEKGGKVQVKKNGGGGRSTRCLL